MSGGPKAAFIVLKLNYSYDMQNAVFLSARDGAEQLGVSKDTVGTYLRELEHYGFIAMVRGAHLSIEGKGKSALYRITDCGYAGKPATREFEKWDGVLFDPEEQKAVGKKPAHKKKPQQPVRKTRTPCPKNSDTEGPQMDLNGNKCPDFSDIRTEIECPNSSDITTIPLPIRSPWYPGWWTSKIISGVAPHPDDIANGEADSPLWVDAWLELEQLAAPTLSLAEIRAFMGYRQ